MLKGLDPILSKEPKALILGSMPSVTSLDKQEYYGFKHNRFWNIMHVCYDMPIDSYEEKKNIIQTQHLILWDVIGSCEREGSLDSAIRNVVVNDIEALLKQYPQITTVLCNGKKSYDLYQKYFSHLQVSCIYVPSTSNANRSLKEEALIQKWVDALHNL
ncbi:DNA-deoxyinosine glycosylase [Amedibacillus sp. YH-ame6]